MDNKNLFERIGTGPVRFVKKGTKLSDIYTENEVSIVNDNEKRSYTLKERSMHSSLSSFIYTNFLCIALVLPLPQ